MAKLYVKQGFGIEHMKLFTIRIYGQILSLKKINKANQRRVHLIILNHSTFNSHNRHDCFLIERLFEDDFGEKSLTTFIELCSGMDMSVPNEDIYEDIEPDGSLPGGYARIAELASQYPSYLKAMGIFVQVLATLKVRTNFWKSASPELVSEYLAWKGKELDTDEPGFIMRVIMDKVFMHSELRRSPPKIYAVAIPHPTISFSKKQVSIADVTFKLEANGRIDISRPEAPPFSLHYMLDTCVWNVLYPVGPFMLTVGHAADSRINVCVLLAWTGHWLEVMNHKAIQCMNICNTLSSRHARARPGCI